LKKGRYLNTPAEDRICKLCNSEVEDEFHFTIVCSKLQSCRKEFSRISVMLCLHLLICLRGPGLLKVLGRWIQQLTQAHYQHGAGSNPAL